MKNYLQPGEVIEYTNATGATIVSGQAFLVGNKLAVAEVDIADGDTGAAAVEGVYSLPAAFTADTAQGADAYWDNAAKKVTDTSAAGANKRIGWFFQAALAADVTAQVSLSEQ